MNNDVKYGNHVRVYNLRPAGVLACLDLSTAEHSKPCISPVLRTYAIH